MHISRLLKLVFPEKEWTVRSIEVAGFFFFKQKTAYEMLRSLVGSEMCIRDRTTRVSVLLLKDSIHLPLSLS